VVCWVGLAGFWMASILYWISLGVRPKSLISNGI